MINKIEKTIIFSVKIVRIFSLDRKLNFKKLNPFYGNASNIVRIAYEVSKINRTISLLNITKNY